ncbi:MAG: hypothetical protein KatS3mg105_1152 [Gemmatales bacterium]|nr:MAG: hypothetical protein KatS3mg105_1152 [Gemmatales bacterium]
MRKESWLSLIRRIPPQLRHKLMIVSGSGNELNITDIYRLEDDFMVVRGRLAGTTDEGSTYFIPYDQIDYMGFRELVKEPVITAMFEGGEVEIPQAPETGAAREPQVPAAEPTPSVAPATTQAVPAKAALLERLRLKRKAEESGQTPPPAQPAPPAQPQPAPAAPQQTNSTPPPDQPTPGKAALLERLRRSRSGPNPGSK